MTPVQKIARIDKQIDAVRTELRRRRRINQMSAGSWQRAWDLEPELKRESDRLFRRRGEQQQLRDKAEWDRQMKAQRAARAAYRRQYQASRCPACGGTMPMAA